MAPGSARLVRVHDQLKTRIASEQPELMANLDPEPPKPLRSGYESLFLRRLEHPPCLLEVLRGCEHRRQAVGHLAQTCRVDRARDLPAQCLDSVALVVGHGPQALSHGVPRRARFEPSAGANAPRGTARRRPGPTPTASPARSALGAARSAPE